MHNTLEQLISNPNESAKNEELEIIELPETVPIFGPSKTDENNESELQSKIDQMEQKRFQNEKKSLENEISTIREMLDIITRKCQIATDDEIPFESPVQPEIDDGLKDTFEERVDILTDTTQFGAFGRCGISQHIAGHHIRSGKFKRYKCS